MNYLNKTKTYKVSKSFSLIRISTLVIILSLLVFDNVDNSVACFISFALCLISVLLVIVLLVINMFSDSSFVSIED